MANTGMRDEMKLLVGIVIGAVGMYLWMNPGDFSSLKEDIVKTGDRVTEKATKAYKSITEE